MRPATRIDDRASAAAAASVSRTRFLVRRVRRPFAAENMAGAQWGALSALLCLLMKLLLFAVRLQRNSGRTLLADPLTPEVEALDPSLRSGLRHPPAPKFNADASSKECNSQHWHSLL